MMGNQMVTHYQKSVSGNTVTWERHALTGAHLSCADGQTVSRSGVMQQGGSVLMVFRSADAVRINSGDYIVPGECPVTEVTGNAKELVEYHPMKVSGRKHYPFRSSMAHSTFTLEGKAWT